MADELGLLTKEQEKEAAKALDRLINSKNPVVELVDGFFFRALVTALDDRLLEKLNVSDEMKLKIQSLIDSAFEGDVEAAKSKAAEISNELVDLPYLDEATEAFLFAGAIDLIVAALLRKAEENA